MTRLSGRQWRHVQDVAAAGAAHLVNLGPDWETLPGPELHDRYRLFLEAVILSWLDVPVPPGDPVPEPSPN